MTDVWTVSTESDGVALSAETIEVSFPQVVNITNNGGTTFEPFIFTQPTPATTWTINHNLDRIVALNAVINTAGMPVLVDWQNVSLNQLVITSAVAFAGVAIIT